MEARRVPAQTIATAIAASGQSVPDVEEAAGLRRDELDSYLNGSDIDAGSLVAVGGLLGLSPRDLYREEPR